jgi:hypothetical protein
MDMVRSSLHLACLTAGTARRNFFEIVFRQKKYTPWALFLLAFVFFISRNRFS